MLSCSECEKGGYMVDISKVGEFYHFVACVLDFIAGTEPGE
jgi:hypothetical protein